MHGTSHQCKFLPKFHPELNPIERVWSRLKWYLRKYNDGKLATLQLLMKKGLDRENVSLTLIRKYCRLVTAYYIAYIDGKDIIQAESSSMIPRSRTALSPSSYANAHAAKL